MQLVVRKRRADIEIRAIVLVPDLSEELLDAARVVLGPAGVVDEMTGRVIVDAIVFPSVFEHGILAAKRTGRNFDRRTRILRAALRIDRERAA